MDAAFRVLFVCLGNICRSPTAEGVFRRKLREAGLSGLVEADSAGTAAWHAGHPPDRRTQAEAARRGVDLSGLRARQVRAADFQDFDLILAMDEDNLRDLKEKAPPSARAELKLFLDFVPGSSSSARSKPREVPDPYHGGPEGFAEVYDLCASAADGLLEETRRRVGPRRASSSPKTS
ncbi:low molecular weight protein-tyrosine-phosphatase [Neomegalonema sp.]|uniref:low molecular weight protein-tyrosine-phosphatase n=1 Tax=Neomegalonema sp. TaxID=2039713 RepID=UPI00262ADF43|nr:low molecular weight protein-tyrosine-phosphatase [Neomegalonema sp.]MDD2869951.1 low molecular weight phosphotyrosine protein phosphatase [Neomegalonema sp.]